MITMIRSSLKLLLRNKGFWFFLVVVPALSSLIFLNWNRSINMGSHSYDLQREIMEQTSITERVAYYNSDGAFVIKVFDAAGSSASEYMLNRLAQSGLFFVARTKTPDIDRASVDAQIKCDCEDDRMGAAMYLTKDFDLLISEGKALDALTLYVMSEDSRYELFESEVKTIVKEIEQAQKQVGVDKAGEFLKERDESLPKKEIKLLSGKGKRSLNFEQEEQKARVGYGFAIMTLGYVFGGIFIAHTIIKEEKDKVLTRIRLTGLPSIRYFGAKFVVSVLSALAMTVMLGLFSSFGSVDSFGMNRFTFLGLMFLLGVIFSTLSLILGVLMGNIGNANICAFTVWSMSSLLAGTYFPLDDSTKIVKAISSIMPQTWFLEATEMIYVGDKKVYLMLLCVVAAYLIVMLSIGSVGIKLRNGEE